MIRSSERAVWAALVGGLGLALAGVYLAATGRGAWGALLVASALAWVRWVASWR